MTSASGHQTDQRRALWFSTAAFTVCFAVWTIFAIIGIQIQRNLGLSDTQLGLLVGTPILVGSLIRLILGIWADQYGGRVVFFITMLSAAVMTALLTFAYDYPTFLLAALRRRHLRRVVLGRHRLCRQVVPQGKTGHSTGHFRRWQCWRRGHEVGRSHRHGGVWLASGCARLGSGAGADRRRLPCHDEG